MNHLFELTNNYRIADICLTAAAKEAFDKCQKAGIINDHNGMEDRPAKDYSYYKFDIGDNTIRIVGRTYVGCNEHDYVYLDVPLNVSLESFISQELHKIQTEAEQENQKRLKEAAEEAIEAEKQERQLFEKLKQKYQNM